ncbi:RNA polymerase Rpc34 [Hypoxylon fuscum]|nr:RNA polymerase Rpc34 [Hypoxylon fuscum]
MDEETKLLKDALYDACQETPDKLFSQDDLMALDIVPQSDIKKLLQLVSLLTKERLLFPVNLHNSLAWRAASKADVAKYKLLTNPDQILVYEMIDRAGPEGIWNQDIKRKLNMQDNALRKATKELEAKRFIHQFASVENTQKKMWIKSGLEPSVRATGGPWYTDQFLDEAFIDALMDLIVRFLKKQDSYRTKTHDRKSASPVMPKKGIIMGGMSEAAIKSRKRSADVMSKEDDPFSNQAPVTKVRGTIRVPYPAGYVGYPTTQEIQRHIVESSVTKGAPLEVAHVQELIDILIWENRIEEVKMGDRVGYRTVRISKQHPDENLSMNSEDYWEPKTNGFTTVPCGKCPVFELCEEGGPVWAGGCEYFDQWLI